MISIPCLMWSYHLFGFCGVIVNCELVRMWKDLGGRFCILTEWYTHETKVRFEHAVKVQRGCRGVALFFL